MEAATPVRGEGPLRVGLTGGIGSGKSTVARLLADRGARVIDWDALAREASEDPGVLEGIRRELGEQLVTGGRLDRQATARLVFADEEARRRLESIIHPWVRRRGRELELGIAAAEPPPRIIVHDIPLLFESGRQGEFDVVLVVAAPDAVRSRRVSERSGMSREEYERRDGAQLPLEEKVERADLVIVNDGELSDLAVRVAEVWRQLLMEAGAR